MKYKRVIIISGLISLLLLIPLIAMQFTPEVNWSIMDFFVASVILLCVGFGIDLLIRKIENPLSRILPALALLVLFVLVWMELAVGIFGSPLAGS